MTEIKTEECAFIIHPVDMTDPKFIQSLEFNDGVHIAFVPLQGFQSCKYYNGSKTWQSLITRATVEVTHVMFPIFEVNTVQPIEYYKLKGFLNREGV